MEPTMIKPRLKMAMAAAEMLYSAKEREPQRESLSRHFLLPGLSASIQDSHFTPEGGLLTHSLGSGRRVRPGATGMDSLVSSQGTKKCMVF